MFSRIIANPVLGIVFLAAFPTNKTKTARAKASWIVNQLPDFVLVFDGLTTCHLDSLDEPEKRLVFSLRNFDGSNRGDREIKTFGCFHLGRGRSQVRNLETYVLIPLFNRTSVVYIRVSGLIGTCLSSKPIRVSSQLLKRTFQ